MNDCEAMVELIVISFVMNKWFINGDIQYVLLIELNSYFHPNIILTVHYIYNT